MNNHTIAEKISQALLSLQNNFASYMNRQTARYSAKRLTIYFAMICLLFCSLSTLFIVEGFTRRQPLLPVPIQHIRIKSLPANPKQHETILTPAIYLKFQRFERFADSLRRNGSTDSLFTQGMLDSIQLLKEIYLSDQNHLP